MKCKVQWIDVEAQPTPDDNEAVGLAQCFDNGVPLGEPLPICAEHLKQLKAYKISWPGTPYEVVTEWKYLPFDRPDAVEYACRARDE